MNRLEKLLGMVFEANDFVELCITVPLRPNQMPRVWVVRCSAGRVEMKRSRGMTNRCIVWRGSVEERNSDQGRKQTA